MLTLILTTWGYPKRKDQLSIIDLLHLAGCLTTETIERDFNDLKFSSIQKETALAVVKDYDPGHILDRLFISRTSAEDVLNWLLQVTQREFFARAPGEDRWQQATGVWMEKHGEKIKLLIQALNLNCSSKPHLKAYDALVIFGSTWPEMHRRMQYAQQLIDEQNISAYKIYLLAGERPVDSKADADETTLGTFAERIQIPRDKLTETHLMQDAYETACKLSQGAFRGIPVIMIDTPKRNLPRPTTITTLTELVTIHHAAMAEWKNTLFISGAPNIQAQKEDTLTVFEQNQLTTTIDCVGAEASQAYPINRSLGAFAGALYGAYMRIAKSFGSQHDWATLEKQRKEFSYAEQCVRRVAAEKEAAEKKPQAILSLSYSNTD